MSNGSNTPALDTHYEFLPSVREGYRPTRQYSGGDLTGRSTMGVSLNVEGVPADGGGWESADGQPGVDLRMYGPGDVTGIDERQVVRTEPEPNTSTFAPNYFPLVEFDRADLPWLFSPERANPDDGAKVRPWMALVVVDRSRDGVSIEADGTKPLPALTTPADELPPVAEVWAWAHVQVVGRLSDPELARAVTEPNDQVVARLLCPRNLDPNTRYHAAVVPTFEPGRLAGLGKDPFPDASGDSQPTIAPAWSRDAGKPVTLPIYHQWSFTTGAKGDFESLARKLEPTRLDRHDVGVREVDLSDPGPLDLKAPDGLTRTVGGALQSAGLDTADYPDVAADGTDEGKRLRLREVLNDPESAAGMGEDGGGDGGGEGGQTGGSGGDSDDGSDLPVVGPPIYGRWYLPEDAGWDLGETGVPEPPGLASFQGNAGLSQYYGTWIHDLNCDPQYRLPASYGTEVVQENQEQLMEAAWKMFGDLEQANERMASSQAGDLIGRQLDRRIAGVDAARFSQRVVDPVALQREIEQLEDLQRSEALPGDLVVENVMTGRSMPSAGPDVGHVARGGLVGGDPAAGGRVATAQASTRVGVEGGTIQPEAGTESADVPGGGPGTGDAGGIGGDGVGGAGGGFGGTGAGFDAPIEDAGTVGTETDVGVGTGAGSDTGTTIETDLALGATGSGGQLVGGNVVSEVPGRTGLATDSRMTSMVGGAAGGQQRRLAAKDAEETAAGAGGLLPDGAGGLAMARTATQTARMAEVNSSSFRRMTRQGGKLAKGVEVGSDVAVAGAEATTAGADAASGDPGAAVESVDAAAEGAEAASRAADAATAATGASDATAAGTGVAGADVARQRRTRQFSFESERTLGGRFGSVSDRTAELAEAASTAEKTDASEGEASGAGLVPEAGEPPETDWRIDDAGNVLTLEEAVARLDGAMLTVSQTLLAVESVRDHCDTASTRLDELQRRLDAAERGEDGAVEAIVASLTERPTVGDRCRAIGQNTYDALARQLGKLVAAEPAPLAPGFDEAGRSAVLEQFRTEQDALVAAIDEAQAAATTEEFDPAAVRERVAAAANALAGIEASVDTVESSIDDGIPPGAQRGGAEGEVPMSAAAPMRAQSAAMDADALAVEPGQRSAEITAIDVSPQLETATAELDGLLTAGEGTTLPGVLDASGWTKRAAAWRLAPELLERDVELAPILAAPEFEQPMYRWLKRVDQGYLLPGAEDVPTNSVGAVETNSEFIESFMAGLNHEMGRELLWRKYPTDRRGTYFRQFWEYLDQPDLKDVRKLHRWRTNDLGDNRDPGISQNRVVLMIRGELLDAYPNTRIYAVKAVREDRTDSADDRDWDRMPLLERKRQQAIEERQNGVRDTLPDYDEAQLEQWAPKQPIFRGKLDPGITFLGFELTTEAAEGETLEETDDADDAAGETSAEEEYGWFFVLEEPVGETRFGLDVASEGDHGDVPYGITHGPAGDRTTPQTDEDAEHGWSALSWGHLVDDPDALDAKTYVGVGGDNPGGAGGGGSGGGSGSGGDPWAVEAGDHWNPDTEAIEADEAATWGLNSAHMASITWQLPVRICIHADDMLPDVSDEPGDGGDGSGGGLTVTDQLMADARSDVVLGGGED